MKVTYNNNLRYLKNNYLAHLGNGLLIFLIWPQFQLQTSSGRVSTKYFSI